VVNFSLHTIQLDVYGVRSYRYKNDDDDDDDDDNNNNNNNNNNNTLDTSNESKVTILCNQSVKTDRTFPYNKLDIIIRDNKKRNMCVNRCCNFRGQECGQERSRESSKI